MNKRTRIVFVSDMHVGSIYALAPLGSIPQDKQSPFIKWVYSQWEQFSIEYFNPDYLLLGGDLADGSSVKSLGVGALTTNLDEQEAMSVKLLRMLIGDSTKVFGINGSGYHAGEGQATDLDRRITEKLGGEYKGEKFEFDIGLERIQVTHGGGSGINLSSYIVRELDRSKNLAQKRKAKAPTILLRGHQHRMCSYQDDFGCWGIVNGCWQYTTPFIFKKTANTFWNIGATIIDIEDGIAKVYRAEYQIPEDVVQFMDGYEVLQEAKQKERDKIDHENWLKLQRERK